MSESSLKIKFKRFLAKNITYFTCYQFSLLKITSKTHPKLINLTTLNTPLNPTEENTNRLSTPTQNNQ